MVRWLCGRDADADCSGLRPAAEVLHSLGAPWAQEALTDEDGWVEATPKPRKGASRCRAALTAARIAALGPEGAYAEVNLGQGAPHCWVGLSPADTGAWPGPPGPAFVGMGSGDRRAEGGETPHFRDGDVVGIRPRESLVELSLNGRPWAQLPYPEAFKQGCAVVASARSHKGAAEVSFNVGQHPFAFPPGDVFRPWLAAAGTDTFQACLERAQGPAQGLGGPPGGGAPGPDDKRMSRPARAECWAAEGEGTFSGRPGLPPAALAQVMLETLVRNAERGEQHVWRKEKVFESLHPYHHNTRDEGKVEIKGARSLRVLFDPRCSTETFCDILILAKDEAMTQSIGQRQYYNIP